MLFVLEVHHSSSRGVILSYADSLQDYLWFEKLSSYAAPSCCHCQILTLEMKFCRTSIYGFVYSREQNTVKVV